ncbi:MAG: hypothetical protein J6T37_06885 [Bacteroidales bacterium]|nr:hypothetical protein [Bacteroidales bacterium]
MDEEVYKSLYERPFAEQIVFNIEQLNYRFARLSEIDTTKKENQKEYLMLFDSFLALFRALFLEKGTKQYTIQNYYRGKGQPEVSKEIDDYLDDKIFSWSDKTIREVLKFIADKFVCHIDPISIDDLGCANFYMSHLGNPYVKNNLNEIMDKISRIVNKG